MWRLLRDDPGYGREMIADRADVRSRRITCIPLERSSAPKRVSHLLSTASLSPLSLPLPQYNPSTPLSAYTQTVPKIADK